MEGKNFIEFGDYLKQVRFNKNLTLETISDEIKISVKYLRALEDSNVETFPNEVLAIGFLRTYSEYLDIDIKYISTLFKEYQKNLKSSYIGIRSEEKTKKSEFLKNLKPSRFDFSKINDLLSFKFIFWVCILGFLTFLFFNSISLKGYVSAFFRNDSSSSNSISEHNIDFNKNKLWNLDLQNNDQLVLIYEKITFKFKIAFVKDILVIIEESNKQNMLDVGQILKIDFDSNMFAKVMYDHYSNNNKKARVTFESVVLNYKYVTEASLGDRFNILNWGFKVQGPKLKLSELKTIHSSSDIKPLKVNLNFLKNSLIRYANNESLEGKSLLTKQGDVLSLVLDKSLILFFTRLSDVDVSIENNKINELFEGENKELVAYQFFWVKTPSGFELKFSEVY